MFEKILCNFLVDRTAKIKMNDQISGKMKLESGVPQGAILSPTLYIYYTSDLPPPEGRSYDIMFADDITQVIISPEKSII